VRHGSELYESIETVSDQTYGEPSDEIARRYISRPTWRRLYKPWCKLLSLYNLHII